jgi:hypothetical protein
MTSLWSLPWIDMQSPVPQTSGRLSCGVKNRQLAVEVRFPRQFALRLLIIALSDFKGGPPRDTCQLNRSGPDHAGCHTGFLLNGLAVVAVVRIFMKHVGTLSCGTVGCPWVESLLFTDY